MAISRASAAGRRANAIDPSLGIRSQVSRERLVFILISVMLGMLLAAVDQTVVGTAMPRIIADLNGLKEYAWVTTSYLLASTVMVPLYGKLSDLYGRKPFFILGMVLFLLGSALSGTSHTMTQLILYRGIQGLGGGAMMPIAIAIIGDIFPPAERGRWQGLLMAVFGLASIVGPWAGGFITDHWSWRWVFYVNMPIGAVALIFAATALPSIYRKTQHAVDYIGAAILVVAAVPMLLGFSWAGNQYTWGNWHVLGGFALSLVGWVAFILWEMYTKEPIIEPRLFKNSIFSVSVAASFLVSLGMFGAIMYIPLFTQAVVGDSAQNSGMVLTPMMLGFMASSVIGGQILSRTGKYKVLAIVSMAIAVFGMFLLSRMGASVHNGLVVRNMVITGLGMGTMMSLFTIVVQNAFPFSMLGSVTSTLQFFRSIGSTVGIAVFGSVLTARFTHELPKKIPLAVRKVVPPHALSGLSNPSTLLSSQAASQMQHAFAKFGPEGALLAKGLLHGVRLSLAMGADRVFFLGALLLAASLITLFFLKEIALKKKIGDMPSAPVMNGHTARAVLGLAIAKRLQAGGFANDLERQRAHAAAIYLLRQYLAYQEALSIGRQESAATTADVGGNP
ncbi:MDR family MFS transporter [Sulfobacillus harzensis]|uniref:MFS transporter n=1 Tax=Sulfobacillus harzensis TaxID=2729629 RepID=A0A7Y0L5Q6_9FIRM|nr:MDR family MFS transporter [Sulfobacillus harzensis]NMP23452.1 MFS transporter [Sulfobacillus harzensis]